jgi:hypothetical protein
MEGEREEKRGGERREECEEPQADLNQSKKRLPAGCSDVVRARVGDGANAQQSPCEHSLGLGMTFVPGGLSAGSVVYGERRGAVQRFARRAQRTRPKCLRRNERGSGKKAWNDRKKLCHLVTMASETPFHLTVGRPLWCAQCSTSSFCAKSISTFRCKAWLDSGSTSTRCWLVVDRSIKGGP